MEDARNPRQLGAAFAALMSPRPKVETTALKQLEALGFAAGDVRHIVTTHLDLDHAGGLPDFPAGRGPRPRARSWRRRSTPPSTSGSATSAAPTGSTSRAG